MALTGPARLGPVPLRLAAGASLTAHGYHWLFAADIGRLADSVQRAGLPRPELLAQLSAWGALAGGVLLVLGFATRLAALWNAVTLGVVLWRFELGGDPLAHWRAFLAPGGYEFTLLLFASCLALLLLGAGTLSVDAVLSPAAREP